MGVFGGGSIQVARIFGIRIGVTPSWFVVLFVFILNLSGYFREVLGGSSSRAYVVAVLAVLLFYLSLIAHELGHALVARRQGIAVERIDLWLFGGLAQIGGQTRSPGAEFALAGAGPLVSALVLGACLLAGALLESPGRVVEVATLQSAPTSSTALVLLGFLGTMNGLLLALNLLPGFPLDGGRMLLAVLWRVTGDRRRATRLAGRGGQVVALALAVYGLYLVAHGALVSGLLTLGLAWLLNASARTAVAQGQVERLQDVTVAEVMDPHPTTLPAATTVLDAHERFFEPEGWAFVAVTDEARRLLGVLQRTVVDAELAAGRPSLPVGDLVGPVTGEHAVSTEAPLRAALNTEDLARLGAVFAVDHEGVLRGVVTLDHVRRALALAGAR